MRYLTCWFLSGSPHASPKRNDPWHASVTLRRKDDFKGSGLSLHVYPDGTVVPSKPEFPVITLAPATRDEVGEENSCWLNPEYVADWQTSNQVNASAGSVKGKGKAEAGSSNSSSSKQYKSSSRKHGSSSSRKGKEKAEASGEYSKDPDTGALYRYAENGAVVYLDFDSQREFYCDEQGQAVWL